MEYISLTISAQTLNTLGAALQELPYKLANPAILEIDAEVKRYLAQKEKAHERAESGETGNSDGDGHGPDRHYTDQG